jgi:hypothetical protein
MIRQTPQQQEAAKSHPRVRFLSFATALALTILTAPLATATESSQATTHVAGVKPLCSGPPSAPVLIIDNVTRNGADLTWSTADGATRYDYALAFQTSSGWTAGDRWDVGWVTVSAPTVVRVQKDGATAFLYGVAAKNGCGITYAQGSCIAGNPAGQCRTVQLQGRPSVPTAVTASSIEGGIEISWVAPTDDGGAPVTDYTVTASPGGRACTSEATSCRAKLDLPSGTSVVFTVTANNEAGASDASAPSKPIKVPDPPPNPPRGVRITNISPTSVTIAWRAPNSSGRRPVKLYIVSASPGDRKCQSTTLTCRMAGLTPGSTYTFTVTANDGNSNSTATKSKPTRLPRQQFQPQPKPSQQLS